MALTKTTPFFGAFPKIQYDINNTMAASAGSHETVTDIFFRFGVIKSILNDIAAYYVYEIQDTDTPEILAQKVYGDQGAGWIIIYANKIVDPLFDWPLNYDAFSKMIIDRYGSIGTAQSTIHHCEKVIKRYNSWYDTTTESRFVIDNKRLTERIPDAPYNYYTPYTVTTFRTADSSVFTADSEDRPFLTADLNYDDAVVVSKTGSIAYANEFNTYEVDGKTIHETIYGEAISVYDWELRKNESKRLIKIIKSDYYNTIMKEFNDMTNPKNKLLRRLG